MVQPAQHAALQQGRDTVVEWVVAEDKIYGLEKYFMGENLAGAARVA